MKSSIFAKTLYQTKRERDYKMLQISTQIAGINRDKVYDFEKIHKNSLYGTFYNQENKLSVKYYKENKGDKL